MAVMKGGAFVSEPFMLGVRALGICGRLQRFYRYWDDVTAMPVRPSSELKRAIPSRVWSLSAALGLVTALDIGIGVMFRRLEDFPVDRRRHPPMPSAAADVRTTSV